MTMSPDVVMSVKLPPDPVPAGELEGVQGRIQWLTDPILSHVTLIMPLHGGHQAAGGSTSALTSSIRQRMKNAKGLAKTVKSFFTPFVFNATRNDSSISIIREAD